MTTVFAVDNHHVASCGDIPSAVAEELRTSSFRSYFENKYGEQWIFYYNRGTQQITVRGGDCGWASVMHPVRVSIHALTQLATPDTPHFLFQIILAGKIAVPHAVLRQPKITAVTFLMDEQEQGVNLNEAESIWLDACIAACEAEVPVQEEDWFRDYVNRIRMKAEPAAEDPAEQEG